MQSVKILQSAILPCHLAYFHYIMYYCYCLKNLTVHLSCKIKSRNTALSFGVCTHLKKMRINGRFETERTEIDPQKHNIRCSWFKDDEILIMKICNIFILKISLILRYYPKSNLSKIFVPFFALMKTNVNCCSNFSWIVC